MADSTATVLIRSVGIAYAFGAALAAGVDTAEAEEGAAPGTEAAAQDSGAAGDEDPPALRYWLPDVPPNALTYDGERLWLRPIFALLVDYTLFDQNEASFTQVGEQGDAGELRAGRLALSVRSKAAFKWNAFLAADYQEPGTREGPVFRVFDLRVGLPLGRVNLMIGKQKEPFVYELSGFSALLPQQERILSPFFVSRSIGVKLFGNLHGDRMTWAAGWFNDWLDSGHSFSDNGNDYAARVTRLVSVSPDGLDYLHLGLAFRRVGADQGTMRFSGRPESNVADPYLDTGEFPASHASEVALEAMWNLGGITLMGEHIEAQVDAPDRGDPRFRGSYVLLSWMLTGESRPYDRIGGFGGAVTPTGRLGALELVTRYSRIDLVDAAIDGGRLYKWHFGVNWWASQNWKAGISYGDADLERGGLVGNTKLLLARWQWVY